MQLGTSRSELRISPIKPVVDGRHLDDLVVDYMYNHHSYTSEQILRENAVHARIEQAAKIKAARRLARTRISASVITRVDVAEMFESDVRRFTQSPLHLQ